MIIFFGGRAISRGEKNNLVLTTSGVGR